MGAEAARIERRTLERASSVAEILAPASWTDARVEAYGGTGKNSYGVFTYGTLAGTSGGVTVTDNTSLLAQGGDATETSAGIYCANVQDTVLVSDYATLKASSNSAIVVLKRCIALSRALPECRPVEMRFSAKLGL